MLTQESLTHGPVKLDDPRFKQAPIQDLVCDGPYKLIPVSEIRRGHKPAGLYSLQVVLRTHCFPPPDRDERPSEIFPRIYSYNNCSRAWPVTKDYLKTAQKVARNFMNTAESAHLNRQEPQLHVFLFFLSFYKRIEKDPVLIEWIQEHYSSKYCCYLTC